VFEVDKMTAADQMPVVSTGGLGPRPELSLLEQSRQALARIESEMCQKLKAIASLSVPPGMDDVQWQSTRTAMEAQVKKDGEREKIPYKAVTQLSELYQIYDSLLIDDKTLPALPKENASMLTDDKQSAHEEAEKAIETLLHQASQKNASLKLDLSGILLDSVPDAIQNLSSTLVKLDLSNNNLKSLPESVMSLVNLIHLDLHSNQLTALPDSVGNLVKLKALNVSGNSLAVLPNGIESCRSLEELIADFNQLTRLPEALGFELLNIRKLSVRSNKLTSLPYSTSHMMSLRFLDVHMNRLGGLPEDLENLMNLEYLDLSSNFNYLVALPESIGSLTSLIELNISYNQITALPDSIGRLEKLQHLNVEGNPLVVPPPRVVAHSVVAIKEYMENRLNAQRGENNRGMKNGHQSWLRKIILGKWVKCGTPRSDVAQALSWQEYRPGDAQDDGTFSSISTPRGRSFFSPLRIFSPRHSSSPLRAFATPRRTPHHVYSPRHV